MNMRMWSTWDSEVCLLWWKVGFSLIKIVFKEKYSRNCCIASYLLFEDLINTLESVPMIITESFVLCRTISEFNCDRTSRNSSSCPDVGRYAVYAMIFVSECFSTYFNPQNLSEIVGSFSMDFSRDLFQPIAVPCQTGPVWRMRSSIGLNISAEVVRKLKSSKSFDGL